MGEMSFAMVFWRCESLTKVCWLLAGVFSLLVFLSRRVLFVGGGCLCCFIWFKINAYDNPLLLYDFILRTQVRSNLLLSLCSVVLLWSSGAGIYSSLSVLGLRLSRSLRPSYLPVSFPGSLYSVFKAFDFAFLRFIFFEQFA